MILLIDNFDSFSYNLVDYLGRCGAETRVIRNDSFLTLEDLERFSGVVISPGPETPERSGRLMEWLSIIAKSKPLLGICLGHQAIGEYFGGKLIKASRPMHGKISEVKHNADVLFAGIPETFKVVRYNSLLLDNVGELNVIAEAGKEIMAVKHPEFPVWGVQFHPEAALTKFGLKIISNWLEYNNIA